MFEKNETTQDNLSLEISDAISEKESVKFTINIKTEIPSYTAARGQTYSVVRSYSDFVWLHTSLSENELYYGLLIPPKPYKPDFESSSHRMHKLKEDENQMTQEEQNQVKTELESEYLALFKKTVAVHETFLTRVVQHETLRNDHDLRIFLTFDGELEVRGKNAKEKITSWFNKGQQAFDNIISDKQTDPDDFYESKKLWLNEYHTRIQDGRKKANEFTKAHRDVGQDYGSIGFLSRKAITIEAASSEARKVGLDKICNVVSLHLPKLKKWEVRAGTDTELKLNDLFKYYDYETSAAKDLLYRRQKTMENLEKRNRELEMARVKNKDIIQCEQRQQETAEKFEKLSALGKEELKKFSNTRFEVFQKNLVELGELQVKHSRNRIAILEKLIGEVENVNTEL